MAFKQKKSSEIILTTPTFFWLLFLFFLPAIILMFIGFKPATYSGGIGSGWSLQNLKELINPIYPSILLRTIYISIITTVFSIFLALPASYYIARLHPKKQRLFLTLIIIPFWTSFLIRILSFRILLHPDGIIKKVLLFFGLSSPDAILLYNQTALIIVLIYTSLPFAILPLYSAASKFDFTLLEAARDLGATSFKAFSRIFLPGISRGILTAALVVFIPALGSYVVPELVGGPGDEMLGNKIAQRVFVDRNIPQAAILSTTLLLLLLIPCLVIIFMQFRKGKTETLIVDKR